MLNWFLIKEVDYSSGNYTNNVSLFKANKDYEPYEIANIITGIPTDKTGWTDTTTTYQHPSIGWHQPNNNIAFHVWEFDFNSTSENDLVNKIYNSLQNPLWNNINDYSSLGNMSSAIDGVQIFPNQPFFYTDNGFGIVQWTSYSFVSVHSYNFNATGFPTEVTQAEQDLFGDYRINNTILPVAQTNSGNTGSTTGESGENPDTTYGLEYTSNYNRDLNTYSKLLEDVGDNSTDDVTFTYTPTNPDVNFFAPSKMFDQDRRFISIYNPDGTRREDIDTTETEVTYTGIGSVGKPIMSNAQAQSLASQYSSNPHQYLDYLNNPDKYAIDTYLLIPENVNRFIKAIIEVGKINQSQIVKNVQQQIKEKGV